LGWSRHLCNGLFDTEQSYRKFIEPESFLISATATQKENSDVLRALHRALKAGGLNDNEASAYLVLLAHGQLKASDVSQLLGLNREEGYDILRKLQERNFVEATMGRPMLFKAEQPETVIWSLETSVKRELEEKSESFLEARKHVGELHNLSSASEFEVDHPGRVKILLGREKIYRKVSEMYARSEHEILRLTTERGVVRGSLNGFTDALAKARNRGVAVKVLAPVSQKNVHHLKNLPFETRHLLQPNGTRLALIDGLETIIESEHDDSLSLKSKKDSAVWTDDAHMVQMIRTMFLDTWDQSPNIDEAFRNLRKDSAVRQTKMTKEHPGLGMLLNS
jgi:sugar-specific transcriptional regulator TrmB